MFEEFYSALFYSALFKYSAFSTLLCAVNPKHVNILHTSTPTKVNLQKKKVNSFS